MLRIKMELVPYGDENNVEQIGEIVIANDSTGDEEYGNYVAWIGKHDYVGKPERLVKIRSHKRSEGAWELLRKVIADVEEYGHRVPQGGPNGLDERLRQKLGELWRTKTK